MMPPVVWTLHHHRRQELLGQRLHGGYLAYKMPWRPLALAVRGQVAYRDSAWLKAAARDEQERWVRTPSGSVLCRSS